VQSGSGLIVVCAVWQWVKCSLCSLAVG